MVNYQIIRMYLVTVISYMLAQNYVVVKFHVVVLCIIATAKTALTITLMFFMLFVHFLQH